MGTLKELNAQSYYDLAVGTFVFMGPFLHKKILKIPFYD